MQLKDLVKTVIEASHGWAVAEQFESTFDSSESFGSQNINALKLIRGTVSELLRSQLLSNESFEDLSKYVKRLYDHLTEEVVH
jgi:hypothetical protein